MTDKVHHQTRKAADISLAKRRISPASYRAVLAGEITLQAARDLGRDRGPDDTGRASGGPGTATGRVRSASAEDGTDTPPQPVSRISKNDRSRECMCGCDRTTHGRFSPGHDQRLLKYAYEYVKGERELTKEQLAYVRDETNKLDLARARVERVENKNRQKDES